LRLYFGHLFEGENGNEMSLAEMDFGLTPQKFGEMSPIEMDLGLSPQKLGPGLVRSSKLESAPMYVCAIWKMDCCQVLKLKKLRSKLIQRLNHNLLSTKVFVISEIKIMNN
jgi:hypothetical protein